MDGKLKIVKNSLNVYLENDDEDNKPKDGDNKWKRRKEKSEKWHPEETEKFYKALQIFGTDFSIISKLLPGRTRKQIKNKFNKEEHENSDKIDLILKQAGTYTLEEFQKSYGSIDKLVKGTGDSEQYLREKIATHLNADIKEISPKKVKLTKVKSKS